MTFAIQRRRALKLAATMAASRALDLKAQDKSPLRIIVPTPAGGVGDAAVRFFADAWTNITKQSIIVDNRPGGSFLIAMQALSTAPADGNTWIHRNNGMSAAQATFGRYDLTKQIVPIGMMGTTHSCIFVSQNSPIRSATDLIDWLKANPRQGELRRRSRRH
jgi:tripartite-type tricarboxylate transporter receptor subunit TctC